MTCLASYLNNIRSKGEKEDFPLIKERADYAVKIIENNLRRLE